ncbi:alpha/beta hydrolase [Nocardioides antri]|uniref:Alpha/beta hydrolase n=1 Tax=Nocardioides antri TaxID=2607659 RepID=A0A5B1M0V4_9ACTN|nr:alpha/beta hydrolase [Nocardioides antri]KAA1426384.1 alpha/beta hydrolase [Nocardioides antri]
MRQQKLPPTRASLRSHAAARMTSLTLRPLTTVVPPTRPGLLVARRIVATSLAVLGPGLPGSRVVRVDRSTPRGPSVRGEWVRGPRARRDDAVILYVHGSAYTLCSARTHRGITTRLSQATGLPVFACDYRLAPRHRFPSAADDVRAAYEWLLAEGHDPGRIVLAGDSAGGHLVVDLALQLLQEGARPPAVLALFSPLFDPTFELAAARERLRRDPMISAARAQRLLDLYFGEEDRAAPRLRLSFDGAGAFPPTLVQAGGREMMAADAEELARALVEAGGRCELEVWPGQMHVFQALARVVPEAALAIARAADFVVAELDAVERRGSFELLEGA